MKLYRTPSIKKSFKARTTRKLKRSMKRAINPTYGKKGMGWAKNPKRAMYNKVYNKCTIDTRPISYASSSKKSRSKKTSNTSKYDGITPFKIFLMGILLCMSFIGLPIGLPMAIGARSILFIWQINE